jgi:hypothetical protein
MVGIPKNMSDLREAALELCGILESLGIEFAIGGAFAVPYTASRGRPRISILLPGSPCPRFLGWPRS